MEGFTEGIIKEKRIGISEHNFKSLIPNKPSRISRKVQTRVTRPKT